jgi:hypothetical protein
MDRSAVRRRADLACREPGWSSGHVHHHVSSGVSTTHARPVLCEPDRARSADGGRQPRSRPLRRARARACPRVGADDRGPCRGRPVFPRGADSRGDRPSGIALRRDGARYHPGRPGGAARSPAGHGASAPSDRIRHRQGRACRAPAGRGRSVRGKPSGQSLTPASHGVHPSEKGVAGRRVHVQARAHP